MKFTIHTDDITQQRTDLCTLIHFEEGGQDSAAFRALDKGLGGILGQLITEEQFQGKKGQSLQLHTHGKVGPARILILGAGPRKDFQVSDLRGLCARAARSGHAVRAKNITVVLPQLESMVQKRAVQFMTEGALQGTYLFDRYLSGERKKPCSVEELRLALGQESTDPVRQESIRQGVQRGERISQGVMLARDLVNEPAAEITPRKMAEIVQRLAKEGHLECKVLGPKECEKMGMGMYLAVARGSDEEPRFLHLTYRPRDTPRKRVVLIGKGVTFDSGGLSLKTSQAMSDMKIDMAGAATVISALSVIAALGSPHEVHAIAACTENMPSGRAYKLGDVLTAMNGKTVEINNTDAEGRLTLGDAMAYAVKEIKPDEIIDFATLTGACMIALGPHTAGVMGNDLSLVERFLTAARLSGEEMWHLPMPERLKDMLKSEIADMKNTGDRYGGALTAGIFLKEFVGDTPWVHVDIAGPAASDKEWGHQPKGATGFGVATVVEYLVPRE